MAEVDRSFSQLQAGNAVDLEGVITGSIIESLGPAPGLQFGLGPCSDDGSVDIDAYVIVKQGGPVGEATIPLYRQAKNLGMKVQVQGVYSPDTEKSKCLGTVEATRVVITPYC